MAKVGSQPITKKQLRAVIAKARSQYDAAFPARGSAEYRLVQEQAIDFLVQQSLAHQADAELGIEPQDRVVTHASWLKVVSRVHVSDAQVRATFAKDPKRYKPGPNQILDRGTATEIRTELLRTERNAAMHRFVSDAEKRWPVTYSRGYRPTSELALARKVWAPSSRKACDLPPGTYSYAKARAHGCLASVPLPGIGAPVCSLLGPEGPNGFSGAEEDDGYANYLEDNGGTCDPDPRSQTVQVDADQSSTAPAIKPVKVSYLPGAGTVTYRDPLLDGVTLRYPRRLHIQHLEYGSLTTTEGVEIANFPLDPSAPTSRPLSAGAVVLLLTDGGGSWPGPTPVVKLPIELTDRSLASGYSAVFSAAGGDYDLSIGTGSSPSHRDLDALRAIAASIHFPPLRVGHVTPNGLYVLGRESAYPRGSVTGIPAISTLRSGRFYLEHAADGFWTITWPDNLLHGYKACGPHYDARRRRFTCPSGAVWDLKGRVVTNPDPARDQDDPLYRQQVGVADGYVLVPLPPRPY